MASSEGSLSHTPAPGFLGSTSFSAVYQEYQNLAGLQQDEPSRMDTKCGQSQRLYFPGRESQVRKGMACLALLTEMPYFSSLIRKWEAMNNCLALMSPFTAEIQSSIDTLIYKPLLNASPADREHLLLRLSTQIYKNSMRDLEVPPNCTIDQYATLLAHPNNIRWEAIGLWFAAVGLGACYVNDEPSRAVIEERRRLAKSMQEAADVCINFCEELGYMTDAELWLYSQNTHLVSVVEGDASYMFWRRLGDLVSAVVTKGLHTEITVSRSCPFWLSEMRKRTFSTAYNLDKSLSSFMGRPPRLPRKYCSLQLPLDLDLEHLRMSAADLEVELDKLDDQGWNTVGEFRSNLYPRTGLICNMIREDILELTLASIQEDNLAVVEDILRRSQAAWDALPQWVREMPSALNKKASTKMNLFISNELALNFKYNEFLLYRTIMQRFPSDSADNELLRISSNILTSILESINRNNVTQYDANNPWDLSKFALPPAGILALELLRRSQGLSQHGPNSPFNRSNVIQSLSNLVAALKWAVLPIDGNYEICNQARQVIERILDRVLSPQPPIDGVGHQDDQAMSIDYSWLEHVRSEPEFWSSLPKHPLLAGFEP